MRFYPRLDVLSISISHSYTTLMFAVCTVFFISGKMDIVSPDGSFFLRFPVAILLCDFSHNSNDIRLKNL
jgi:hypothetical protein